MRDEQTRSKQQGAYESAQAWERHIGRLPCGQIRISRLWVRAPREGCCAMDRTEPPKDFPGP